MPSAQEFPGDPTDVTHKTALITGAAQRIGRAIAESLASAGWKVAIHYARSGTEAETLAAALRAKGAHVATVAGDLERAEAPARIVTEAAQKLGPLGCLINNASIFEHDELATASLQSWERHMAINVRAPFFLTQAFAAQVPDAEKGA